MYLLKTKLPEFSAAHRMLDLPGAKCRHLHGHNFSLTVTFASETLNQHGVVIDFFVAHQFFNEWIQENVDHAVIVSAQDYALIHFLKSESQRYYILSDQKNTTIEIIAKRFFEEFTHIMQAHPEKFDKQIKLVEVEIWETQHAGATYGVNGSTISGIPCA